MAFSSRPQLWSSDSLKVVHCWGRFWGCWMMLEDVGDGLQKVSKRLWTLNVWICLNPCHIMSHLWLFFFVIFMGVEEAVNTFSVLLDFSCRFVFSFPWKAKMTHSAKASIQCCPARNSIRTKRKSRWRKRIVLFSEKARESWIHVDMDLSPPKMDRSIPQDSIPVWVFHRIPQSWARATTDLYKRPKKLFKRRTTCTKQDTWRCGWCRRESDTRGGVHSTDRCDDSTKGSISFLVQKRRHTLGLVVTKYTPPSWKRGFQLSRSLSKDWKATDFCLTSAEKPLRIPAASLKFWFRECGSTISFGSCTPTGCCFTIPLFVDPVNSVAAVACGSSHQDFERNSRCSCTLQGWALIWNWLCVHILTGTASWHLPLRGKIKTLHKAS